jgi:hypothetical protein
MLYPAPDSDSKRIPHRPVWGRKSGRRPKMCRYRKDAQNCRQFTVICRTSGIGGGSGLEKARSVEEQNRNDGRTKKQAKDEDGMEERTG